MNVRPATPDDDRFLRDVYCRNRRAEFAEVGWSDEALGLFLETQFRMRKSALAMQYADLESFVVEHQGKPVGSMLFSRGGSEVRLVDIAILPEDQGKGIGSAVITELQQLAADKRLTLVLHVDLVNPRARKLYEQMGFRVTGENSIQYRMEWENGGASSTPPQPR